MSLSAASRMSEGAREARKGQSGPAARVAWVQLVGGPHRGVLPLQARAEQQRVVGAERDGAPAAISVRAARREGRKDPERRRWRPGTPPEPPRSATPATSAGPPRRGRRARAGRRAGRRRHRPDLASGPDSSPPCGTAADRPLARSGRPARSPRSPRGARRSTARTPPAASAYGRPAGPSVQRIERVPGAVRRDHDSHPEPGPVRRLPDAVEDQVSRWGDAAELTAYTWDRLNLEAAGAPARRSSSAASNEPADRGLGVHAPNAPRRRGAGSGTTPCSSVAEEAAAASPRRGRRERDPVPLAELDQRGGTQRPGEVQVEMCLRQRRQVTAGPRGLDDAGRHLAEELLEAGDALDQVVVAERVGPPQVPRRPERLARHDCDLRFVEDELGQLGGGL